VNAQQAEAQTNGKSGYEYVIEQYTDPTVSKN